MLSRFSEPLILKLPAISYVTHIEPKKSKQRTSATFFVQVQVKAQPQVAAEDSKKLTRDVDDEDDVCRVGSAADGGGRLDEVVDRRGARNFRGIRLARELVREAAKVAAPVDALFGRLRLAHQLYFAGLRHRHRGEFLEGRKCNCCRVGMRLKEWPYLEARVDGRCGSEVRRERRSGGSPRGLTAGEFLRVREVTVHYACRRVSLNDKSRCGSGRTNHSGGRRWGRQ
jgi:hypothetical protein